MPTLLPVYRVSHKVMWKIPLKKKKGQYVNCKTGCLWQINVTKQLEKMMSQR